MWQGQGCRDQGGKLIRIERSQRRGGCCIRREQAQPNLLVGSVSNVYSFDM